MLPRARLAVLAACLAAGGLALLRAGPPAPRDSDAPLHEFSALRARERLATLLADGAPHPTGTAANAAVRARLVEQLRALGLSPRELPAFSCTDYGNCGPVVNVLVEVPGTTPGPALLLASHFDSVPAGAGAADDGHGVVVVLEALRALLADGPPRTPLMAVFTDGEESGLLGARAFVEDPAFVAVGAVINIEARGSGGAARMFETSDGNAALISAYATGAPRPSAQSLSYEVYRRLPNDTDLTIFKKAGAQGLGFAFIGDVRHYHTPLDDLDHLDLGSVQQQGDAVLGTARQLLAAGIQPPAGNATYVDLLGMFVLRWPAALDLPLAGLALLTLLFAAWRAIRGRISTDVPSDRSRQISPRALAAAMGSALLAPVVGAVASYAVLSLAGALAGPIGTWPAALMLSLAAGAAAASALAVLVLRGVARRVGARAQALGTWIVWALLACPVAVLLPGASILWIAPAVLAGAGLLLAGHSPRLRAFACALAGALAWCIWAPLLPALTEALGLDALVLGALAGWTWTAASPALADAPDQRHAARLSLGLGVLALALAVAAAVAPRVTPELPAKLNFFELTDLSTGRTRHVLDTLMNIDGLPAEFMADPWRTDIPLPWSGRTMYVSPPFDGPADGPRYVQTSSTSNGDLRRISGTLTPRPGALVMLVVIPGDALTSLTVGGRTLDVATLQRGHGDTRVMRIHGPPAAGLEIVAELRGEAPWVLADMLPGLTDASAELVARRPVDRVPYQTGDLRIAFRSFKP
jgi:hypothetical protein